MRIIEIIYKSLLFKTYSKAEDKCNRIVKICVYVNVCVCWGVVSVYDIDENRTMGQAA